MSLELEATVIRDVRHWNTEPDSRRIDAELSQMLLRRKEKGTRNVDLLSVG